MIELNERLERLLQELKKAQPETYYHCTRVKKLVSEMIQVSNRKGISQYQEREINAICKGALLHDIGKLHLDNALLTNPTRLDNRERERLKQHTLYGVELVRDQLPEHERQTVEAICRYHHERIDGSGYEGERDLPLYVQMVSVCDVFDALHTDRVYRPGMASEKIFTMLDQGACGQFDPALLDLLRETVWMDEWEGPCVF